MLNIIQYDKINKYKLYIPFDINTNSRLYFEKDKIHKIPFYISDDLATTLEYISEWDLQGVIELTDFICDKDSLIGYSFKRYKDFKSLNKYKNRNLNLKLNDCHNIIKAFNELLDCNVEYNDFSLGNILLNEENNKVKIADLDYCHIRYDDEFKKTQLKSVAHLCIAYLYGFNYIDLMVLLKDNTNINKDLLLKEYFSSLDNKLTDFSKILNKLDLDLIKEEKSFLNSKIKRLRKTDYYRKYYL